jgi:hypothetical protein
LQGFCIIKKEVFAWQKKINKDAPLSINQRLIAVNSGVDDKQAQVSDKAKESPAPPESGKTDNAPKDTGVAPSSEGKTSNDGDEAKPISAKEIIGLKKKLKESGKTDDDLAKILPGVKTVGDYRKVIKEYGIAA